MRIPGLGVIEEDDSGEYWSPPVLVPGLRGATCRLLVTGSDADLEKDDFHRAIRNFLAIDESVLQAASSSIFAYYQDVKTWSNRDTQVSIPSPDAVWDHIQIGAEAEVARGDDEHVYVSVECECDWESEHGLQIVFRDGNTVSKVGPFDGHLTNAAAYARPDLEGVVYHRLFGA
ncbi:MAG: DUF6985 domain-containing protein [Micromonosporaceae bacterium]